MHILVAALLALSCFIPVFGTLSTTNAGPVNDGIQNERTLPDFDDREGDSSFGENRVRPDISEGNQDGQIDKNGTFGQNGPDAGDQNNGQNSDQNAPDGTAQNGDRADGKRFNRTPNDQNGTTAPDGAVTPDGGDGTQNNDAPTAQGTV